MPSPGLWQYQSGLDLRLPAPVWSMAIALSGELATSAATTSNVGGYGITQGTLAASGNYVLNYTGNNLTVGQRAITVTADAKSRAYGEANPALTYQVGGSGLVNGDTLSGACGDIGDNFQRCRHLWHHAGDVGGVRQLRTELYGANLTVGQRALTVTADAKSRAYGDANPALTYQVGGSGLVNGDTLSGALATSATTASNVGVYGIGQGTLAASGNYALNYASADLTVDPARAHGDGRRQEPGLWRRQPCADLSGRRLGPGQRRHAVGCTGDIGDNSRAMSAPTASRRVTLAASGNYALNYTSADLTVGQRANSP